MAEISFNLIYNPWIPCELQDGTIKLLTINDVLFNANNIRQISSDKPLTIISIYRFLLAILHRNFGPKNRNEWQKIYKSGKFDEEILNSYFKKWSHKFELFNEPENRFYQIYDANITKKTPISKLYHAISTGNNPSLFNHSWDSQITALKIEEVAQLLLTFQNYAVGGGVSRPFNFSHAPLFSGLIIFLRGDNLFDSLMLNFIRYDNKHPFQKNEESIDIPFWERDEKKLYENKIGRYPNGYLDYLTWQSRRMWLLPFEENRETLIKYVYLAQGEKIKSDWHYDPLKAYFINDKNEIKPIKLLSDRQVWRESESLLRITDVSGKKIPPKTINWISFFVQRGIVPISKQYSLEIYGICNDPKKAAKIINWDKSYIPLSLKFLEDPTLVDNVREFLEKSKKAESILNKTLFLLVKAYLFSQESNLSPIQKNKVSDFIQNYQISIRYWNQLENYFYQFMDEIAKESDFIKRQEIIKYWVNDKIVKLAINLLNIIKQTIGKNPRGLKSFIQIKGYFFKNIQDLKQI